MSVVIPMHNSEETIERCLESVIKYSHDCEIIVVDDGSTDKSCRTVEKLPVKLMRCEHKGPAKARNVGWRFASGDVIMFLDSDVIVTKNFFDEIMKPFSDENVICSQGVYINANKDNTVSRYEHMEIEKQQKHGTTKNMATYATMIKREYIEKTGGFDETFTIAGGEDTDLGFKLLKYGKIFLTKNAKVYHYHNTSLWSYMKKQFQRACWRIYLYREHPHMAGGDDYATKRIHIEFMFSLLGPFGLPIIIALQILHSYRNKGLRLQSFTFNIIRVYVRALGAIYGVWGFIIRPKLI